MDGEPIKRKRGRPCKKKSTDSLLTLPESQNDSDPLDISHGQQIFRAIMKLPKLKPFLEKPDKNLYGLQNYYEVIKEPMWLNEVSRKLSCNEYKNLTEFIHDIQLLLSNCCKFWGSHHKFAKMGLRMKQVFEQQLAQLPENVKKACQLNDSKETKELIFDVELNTDKDCERGSPLKTDNLQDILNTCQEEIDEKELFKWEKEILVSNLHRKQINTFWMLPEIGQFVKLVRHILDFDDITQYEIERMLLMPKESNTLAVIMTGMLCPYAIRGNLCLKPIMYYEVWTEMLRKKVDHWYNIYYKYINTGEVFKMCGIEPLFWAAMGLINPLSEYSFHELTFYQRAWLLKALCSYTFHSNKRVEVAFNAVEETSLRSQVLGDDNNYQYFALFMPEIRVYKQKKSYESIEVLLDGGETNNMANKNNIVNGETMCNILDETKYSGKSKYYPPTCVLPKRKEFCLVAENLESLRKLKESMKKRKNILSALEKLPTHHHNEFTLKGLKSLHKQWKEFRNRSQVSVAQSLEYWIIKNTSYTYKTKTRERDETPIQESKVEQTLGKRIHKKKIISIQESSESEPQKSDGSDSSDWESRNIKKKVRRKVPRSSYAINLSKFAPTSSHNRNLFPYPLLNRDSPFEDSSFFNRLPKLGVKISKQKITDRKEKTSIVNAALATAIMSPQLSIPENNQVLTISLKDKDAIPSSQPIQESTPTGVSIMRITTPQSINVYRINDSPEQHISQNMNSSLLNDHSSSLDDFLNYTDMYKNHSILNYSSFLNDPEDNSLNMSILNLNQTLLIPDFTDIQ